MLPIGPVEPMAPHLVGSAELPMVGAVKIPLRVRLTVKAQKCVVCLRWYVTIFGLRIKHCKCGMEK